MAPRTAIFSIACLLFASAAVAQTPGGAPGNITPDQMVEMARERYTSGQPQEAVNLLRSVLDRFPGHTQANLLYGEILIENNDYNGARDAYLKVLEAEPSNFKAALGYGKILLANRSTRQALSYLERAEAVAPSGDRSEVKQLLAIVHLRMAQMNKAIEKAEEAVRADSENLDALRTLIEIRRAAASRDVAELERAVDDADAYLVAAEAEVVHNPWDRAVLARLEDAYAMKLGVLQDYHNTFYRKNLQGERIDELLPGKGTDAAAALVRIVEATRRFSLLRVILAEHDIVLMAERATGEGYDPANLGYLERLVSTYRQVQDFTARLVGPQVYADTYLQEKALETCRRILELDPQNETALEFMNAVGAAPTTQPAVAAERTP